MLAVVVGGGVLAAWLAARHSVRPDRDATVELPGLAAGAAVAFDRYGVPHIQAGSVEDAVRIQGFLHARDRFFQMELMRRAARGRLAELLGSAALPTDIKMRRWMLAEAAERQSAALDGESRRLLEAYAGGVNAALDRYGARGLAPEMLLLGGSVAPWRAADTVGIGLLMELSLTWAAGEELERAAILAALGREKAVALWGWSESQAEAWLPAAPPAAPPRGDDSSAMPRFSGIGSNNWAVAGWRSLSGAPLLANDPHVGIANPSTWYEVHLETPTVALAGASIAGAPGVLIGHNEHLAWGLTMTMQDDQDLFALSLDESGRRERIGDAFRDLDVRDEVIPVRGAREGTPVRLKASAHGPVVREEGGTVYALAWTALRGSSPLPCFLKLDRATSVGEGAAAFATCEAPGMNLVLADRAGHIRWQVVGRPPRRGCGFGRVPTDGSNPACGWSGFAPFEDNPFLEDPPTGAVASANHDPFAEGDFPGPPFAAEFAPPWRIRTIKRALAGRERWDVAGFVALQADVANPQADALLERLRPVLATVDSDAARILEAWDRRMDAGSRGALLWALFLRELGRRVGGDEAEAAGLAASPIGGGELLRLLTGGLDPAWWDDGRTAEVETARDIVAAALAAAARQAAGMRWGERHRVFFRHALGGVPILGAALNVGPFPAPGAGPCLNATAYSGGGEGFDVVSLPSLRFVADLADWDRSVFTLPLGQSGHFLSRHADDQTADWLAGRVHPMPWSAAAVRAAAVATWRLVPGRE